MNKRLNGAAFLIFLLGAVCIAQSTNGLQFQSSEVALSITVTNSSYTVGAEMTLFAAVRNKSTNDVHLASFIVSLVGENGKTYQLTQPELGNSANIGGDIRNIVRPGRISNRQIQVGLNHYFGAFGIEQVDKNIEPGLYVLKAVQYYDADKLSIQSNLLKVRITK